MVCIISAPASGSGKTLLSLTLTAWAKSKQKSIQTYKVGPDYLDPQQLSLVAKRPCRNLDLILSGEEWVEDSFYKYGSSADLGLVEGAMGLFDGIGISEEGSTAHIARFLKLPIVLIVNARGQAASIGAVVKGFRDHDKTLEIAGVVLNNVNSARHRDLLCAVLKKINIKVLGCLPTSETLFLKSKNLGLAPAHEINQLERRVEAWKVFAENHLDLKSFDKLLKAPKPKKNYCKSFLIKGNQQFKNKTPIAIAEDKAFHFRYPETKEYLEALGIEILNWSITEDEPIPKVAKGLIIPGGFPESYNQEISESKRSLNSIRDFFGLHPIYAECGGMLILGNTLFNEAGTGHKMSGILPFNARKGSLQVGYRKLKATRSSLIINKGQEIVGHEFHKWKLESTDNVNNQTNKNKSAMYKEDLYPSWLKKGWNSTSEEEGWSNNLFHASWIHLHWPSSKNILNLWLAAVHKYK